MSFLSEDKEKAYAFGKFIIEKARWDVGTKDAIDLNRHLAWFNTLPDKIDAHIFELKKVHEAPKPAEPQENKG